MYETKMSWGRLHGPDGRFTSRKILRIERYEVKSIWRIHCYYDHLSTLSFWDFWCYGKSLRFFCYPDIENIRDCFLYLYKAMRCATYKAIFYATCDMRLRINWRNCFNCKPHDKNTATNETQYERLIWHYTQTLRPTKLLLAKWHQQLASCLIANNLFERKSGEKKVKHRKEG